MSQYPISIENFSDINAIETKKTHQNRRELDIFLHLPPHSIHLHKPAIQIQRERRDKKNRKGKENNFPLQNCVTEKKNFKYKNESSKNHV